MLIGNGVRLSASNPMRQFGAAAAGTAERAAWAQQGALRNFYAGEATVVSGASIASLSCYPSGVRHPASWSMPTKAGGLSARNEAQITLSGSASGALGRNIEGSTSITVGVADAALQLIVSASGSAVIAFSGAGTLAGALAAAGTAAITFTVDDATLGAIVSATGTATVSLASDATLTAIGHLAGDITPYTELSPENLAAAVWNALQSAYQAAGTMGEAMSTAGSGGLSPTQSDLLEALAKIHGLVSGSPLTVTSTARAAGGVVQSISESGGTVTVTRTA